MAVSSNMPILLVDDYRSMLRIVRNLLRQLGFENVEEAADGSQALAKMRQRHYGLVIADWYMEPMSGIQLLNEVRADNRLSDTPFIMMTAENRSENVVEARQSGVNNYIIKPFNAETLRAKMATVLS